MDRQIEGSIILEMFLGQKSFYVKVIYDVYMEDSFSSMAQKLEHKP